MPEAPCTWTTSFSRSLSLGYIGGFGYPRQQFSNATVFTRWAKKMRGRGRGPTGLRGQVCSDQKVFQAVWNMIQYGLDCFPGHCSGTRFSLDVSGHCLSFVDFVSYGQWCSDPVFLMHLAPSRLYTQWLYSVCQISSLLVLCTVIDLTPEWSSRLWHTRPRGNNW